MAYDFLYRQSETFIVYVTDKYREQNTGAVKSRERWHTCTNLFFDNMSPALAFLYLLNYKDDELKDSMEIFSRETIEFAIKKVEASEWQENVIEDVVERLQSIKLIVGYSDELIDPKVIEEIYSGLNLTDELTYSQRYWEVWKYHYRLERQLESMNSRKLSKQTHGSDHKFKYSSDHNTLSNLIKRLRFKIKLRLQSIFSDPISLSDISVLPSSATTVLQYCNCFESYF